MKITFNALKSYLVLGCIWAFIGQYFIDAANLDDLLPDAVVFHPEANESSPEGTLREFAGQGVNAQKTLPAPNKINHSSKRQTVRVVIDQDSPSLAPEPLLSIASSKVVSQNPIQDADSFTSSSSLYLLNCTLLI
jgi:hypothetical protein